MSRLSYLNLSIFYYQILLCIVWAPYEKQHIICIYQSSTTWHPEVRYWGLSSVDEMLQELQWNTLEERRKKDRLVMFYKIHNDQTGIDTGKYLKPLGRVSQHVNKVHFAFTDYYKFSYFPRTINEWNVLPNETVNASSLTAFTNYL